MNFKKEIAYIFEKKPTAVAIFLITILGLIIYANSLTGQFIWDDDTLVRDNIYIRHWSHLGKIFLSDIGSGSGSAFDYYRPLHIASYILDYSIWKLNPVGYHVTNVLLHIAVTLCLYWLVRLLFKDNLLSLFTGLIFITHPVQVETVASISIRGDLISVLLMLLCLILYIQFIGKNNKTLYVLMILSYVLALFSKENGLIFPLLLFVYHYAFKIKIKFIPFVSILILAFSYIILRLTILPSTTFYTSWLTTICQRIPGFFVAITNYIKLLIMPFNLHMEYGQNLFKITDPNAIFGISVSVFLLIYALKKIKTNNVFFFSIYWFFVALLPVSNLYPIGFYMAEHYLYLPSIGPFLLFAFGLTKLLQNKKFKNLGIILVICLLAFYSYLTIKQNEYWKEPLSFYERTLKYAPNSSRINNNLGGLYYNKGDYEKAIHLYKKAIELDSNNVNAYFNLAKVYDAIGTQEAAIKAFSKLIEISPRYWRAYNELGLIYYKANQNEKAIEFFKKAININPNYVQSYNNLGMMYNKIGKKEDAIKLYETAIKLNPYFEDSYYNLGNLYLKYDENEKAMPLYRKAIAMNDKDVDAYNNLAIIYKNKGDQAEAIKLLRKAIEINPHYMAAYKNLAGIYRDTGKTEELTRLFNKAKNVGFSDLLIKDLESFN